MGEEAWRGKGFGRCPQGGLLRATRVGVRYDVCIPYLREEWVSRRLITFARSGPGR